MEKQKNLERGSEKWAAKMVKKIPNHKTWSMLVPHCLDQRVRSYILKKNFESLADFIRTAIRNQLKKESQIKYPLPKSKQKIWIFYISPDLANGINNCTAKTNYSSRSDFVRQAVRNQLKEESKNETS